MKAYYTAQTVADNFAVVTTYQIEGRNVALIIGHDKGLAFSVIEAQAKPRENTGDGAPVHEILAVLELKPHDVHDETQYSEAAYWQAEGFDVDYMKALLRANLAARCDIKLISGAELEAVEAAEEEARRIWLYKVMRTEPPENIEQ